MRIQNHDLIVREQRRCEYRMHNLAALARLLRSRSVNALCADICNRTGADSLQYFYAVQSIDMEELDRGEAFAVIVGSIKLKKSIELAGRFDEGYSKKFITKGEQTLGLIGFEQIKPNLIEFLFYVKPYGRNPNKSRKANIG